MNIYIYIYEYGGFLKRVTLKTMGFFNLPMVQFGTIFLTRTVPELPGAPDHHGIQNAEGHEDQTSRTQQKPNGDS